MLAQLASDLRAFLDQGKMWMAMVPQLEVEVEWVWERERERYWYEFRLEYWLLRAFLTFLEVWMSSCRTFLLPLLVVWMRPILQFLCRTLHFLALLHFWCGTSHTIAISFRVLSWCSSWFHRRLFEAWCSPASRLHSTGQGLWLSWSNSLWILMSESASNVWNFPSTYCFQVVQLQLYWLPS